MVPSYVIGYIPCKVLCDNRLYVKRQLQAIVFQGANILKLQVARYRTSRNRNGSQQVGGLAIIAINIETKTSVQGCKIQTCII